jgi:acetyl esterase/lipase
MYIGPDGSQQQADHIRNPLVSPLLADPKVGSLLFMNLNASRSVHCLPQELAQLPPTILVTAGRPSLLVIEVTNVILPINVHIAHTEHDPLYSEGRAFAQAIEALGVPCDYVEARGLVHGYVRSPQAARSTLLPLDVCMQLLFGRGVLQNGAA